MSFHISQKPQPWSFHRGCSCPHTLRPLVEMYYNATYAISEHILVKYVAGHFPCSLKWE